jgi:DNA invertase Pin-like site-specific DNA recombinase
MSAVGYLRKSRVTSDRHLSWDVQEAEIRALAARHGDTELELLSDWGKSGRGEKTALRAGFRRLREMIEADGVSVVYSYSLSRLARSLTEYASLAELCRDRGVKVRLCKEGEFDYSTATGRLIVDLLARFAQFEAELAQERAGEAIKIRRQRGEHIGRAPFGWMVVDGRLVRHPEEDPNVVVDAYRQTGSFHATARLLNQDGYPSRLRTGWTQTQVRRVVQRVNPPDLVLPLSNGRSGVKGIGGQLLFQLLRCPCGRTLTPKVEREAHRKYGIYGPYTSYKCWKGRTEPNHGRPLMVAESKLLPWIKAEAARLQTPEAVEVERGNEQRRLELQQRRTRVLDNYEDGLIDRLTRDAKLEVIASEIEELEVAARVVAVPEIDWTWPAAKVNAVLRAMWVHVQLDDNMRPVSAEWLVPEWRRPS